MSLDRHSNWQKEYALLSIFRLPGLCVHDHGHIYSHGCVLKTRLSKRQALTTLTTKMYLKTLRQAAYNINNGQPLSDLAERRVLLLGFNSCHPQSCNAVGYSRTSRTTLYARHTSSDVKKSLKVAILFFPIAVPVQGQV